MKRYFFILLSVILCVSCCTEKQQKAKYVFYFIGDGMGFNQIDLAEAYKAHLHGNRGTETVSFGKFPVLGRASTYSASDDVTCSSAAGTALSTGTKTNNGFLGIAPDSTDLTSIAFKFKQAGYRVGVSSTVPLNHATPGAFYAHAASRNNYYDIALQLPASGFDFFGGAGLYDYKGKDSACVNAFDLIRDSGYTIAAGMDQYREMKANAAKMYLIHDANFDNAEMPYAVDRPEGMFSHKDIIDAGIDFLYDPSGKSGFFFMSESGRIDWASHGNDTKAALMEVLDFDVTLESAIRFYNEHPNETLIIVTADHETGGFSFSVGHSHKIFFEYVDSISGSKDFVDYLGKQTDGRHIAGLTDKANLGWVSGDHLGHNVPVFAIGAGSERFAGFMDNTDIPKRICEAAGVNF